MVTAVRKHRERLQRKSKGKVPKKRLKIVWGSLDKDGNKVFPFHFGQTKIMKSKARFTAAIAGTGGGKTVLGPTWIMKRIKQLGKEGKTKNLTGMIVAPTYKVQSRATSPTLVETFRGTEFEGRYLESKGLYILPRNLGLLYLLSADSPYGLEGGQLDIGVWLDEGGQVSLSAWLALCRRTGINEAPLLITTTPYLVNWLKTEVLDRYLEGDPDYFAAVWASNANPAYPEKEFERAKATLPKATFDLMHRGLFGSLEGLVYPDFPSCVVEHRDPPEGRKLGGIDFGWKSPFCALSAVLYVEDGKDILYIFRERYQTYCRLKVHAENMPKGHTWFADSSEPEMILDLKEAGHGVFPANRAITPGIEAVNERILTNRLLVSSSCVSLINEMGLYQFPQEEGKDKPIEEIDHAVSALRYLCIALAKKRAKIGSPRKVLIRKQTND